ncbi:uncharacterized protein LOC101861513 [Aplysia californica]|uniref:Uncharacterized protein LOC101861513 n=1 Tax=Aplysia californica TaxID=6500 RepID=A0ABM0JTF1_APLCA|nr:uncharacterized protein LOC101861513 [Aplysia californica]
MTYAHSSTALNMTSSTTVAFPGEGSNVTSASSKVRNGIIGQEFSEWFRVIVDVWISSILSALGVTTNALVIAVFTKQGFKENIAISMTAIAVWDFLKCLCGLLGRLYWTMSLADTVFGKMWLELSAILLSYLHSFMGFVSCALAAYVSTERCLCVSMPFKVKDIFTRRLTITMMMIISTVVFGSFMVVFPLWEITVIFDPGRNASITTLAFSDFHSRFGVPVLLYYNIISIFWPLSSFVFIVVNAAIIVHHLQKSSDFRGNNVKEQENQMSSRDLQVVKMLMVIIAVYIVNPFPRIVQYFARFFEPELYIRMRYQNMFIVMIHVVFVFDFLNASTNLFIFIAMSSKFKATFVKMVGHWWIAREKKEKL